MSWIDRIAGPEGWLRFPWWAWLPVGWVVSLLILQGMLWLDGYMEFGDFERAAITDPFYLLAPLVGYRLLSRTARIAFDRFRPALDEDDHTVADARHRLSSTRPITMWVALVVGGTIGASTYFTDPTYSAIIASSTITATVWAAMGFVSFGLHVVLATLIVRQLRLVADLHRRARRIDLFRPAPLHAFASLTARAGAILVLVAMYSALTDPTTFVNPVWRTVFAIAMTLAAAAFFLPLSGLARRLRAEKALLVDAAAVRMSVIRDRFNAAIDRGALGEIAELRTAMSALGEDQDRIRKVSPWPWETATIRGFATTLLIPITTWLITNLLSRTLF